MRTAELKYQRTRRVADDRVWPRSRGVMTHPEPKDSVALIYLHVSFQMSQ